MRRQAGLQGSSRSSARGRKVALPLPRLNPIMSWVAVCIDLRCPWHRMAPTQASAETYAHLHRVSDGPRVCVIAMPIHEPLGLADCTHDPC